MSRSMVALLTLLTLLGLTAVLGVFTGPEASALGVAATSCVKAALIGAVFLELDRAWPGWALLAALVVGGVIGGAALLIAG